MKRKLMILLGGVVLALLVWAGVYWIGTASPQVIRNSCRSNVIWLESLKAQYAILHDLPDGTPVTFDELDLFVGMNNPRLCPAGGMYVLHPIGVDTHCTVRGHTPPAAFEDISRRLKSLSTSVVYRTGGRIPNTTSCIGTDVCVSVPAGCPLTSLIYVEPAEFKRQIESNKTQGRSWSDYIGQTDGRAFILRKRVPLDGKALKEDVLFTETKELEKGFLTKLEEGHQSRFRAMTNSPE